MQIVSDTQYNFVYYDIQGGHTLNWSQIPYRVLDYIGNQLDIEPETFYQYAQREETRWEHLALIRKEYGYQSFSLSEYRKTSKEIFPHAMENSNGIQLMDLAIDSLRKRKVILPAVSTIERLVWDTRRRAEDKIYRLIDSSSFLVVCIIYSSS